MKIVGLTGLAGSGKDTVASMLCITQGFVQIALADPLRAGLTAMFGVTDEQLADRTLKEQPIDWIGQSPRGLLQTLGTEWGRHHVASDIWLRVAEQRIAALRRSPPCLHIAGVVVSDIRFGNEAAWIRAQGGEVWQILRPGAEGLAPATAAHESERGLLGDLVIFNSGTLDDLFDIVSERIALTDTDCTT